MLEKLNELTEGHGALKRGHGLISGVVALSLAILCFLGVLAFHFPEYLTTPQLRKSYDVDVIRKIMFVAMVIAGGISLVNIIFNRARWLSAFAFLLVALSALLGGHKVDVNPNFPDHTPYIGLDWFILDLLGSSLIFIFIEKLFKLRKEQPVFRPEWQTDFHHFIVNHMIVGFVLLATNLMVHKFFGWAAHDGIRGWVQGLPFWAGVLLIMPGFLTDLAGLALLVPYLRHRFAVWCLKGLVRSPDLRAFLFGDRSSGAGRGQSEQSPHARRYDTSRQQPPPPFNEDGPIIEGEFERLDERTVDHGRDRRRDNSP